MQSKTLVIRLLTKFLLAAILLQAVAPVFSANKSGSDFQDNGWSEVCTVLGTKWVKQSTKLDDGDSTSAPHSALKHCLFCTSTEPIQSFDILGLNVESVSSAINIPVETFFVGLFSGHRILSRAPPQ